MNPVKSLHRYIYAFRVDNSKGVGKIFFAQSLSAVLGYEFCEGDILRYKAKEYLSNDNPFFSYGTAKVHKHFGALSKENAINGLIEIRRAMSPIVEQFILKSRVYPERYQKRYGYWCPVIRSSIDKFLKCGDLKEGFARVRCPDCKEELFVAFSCRQRGCCPSCGQKRALLIDSNQC